MTHSPDVSNWQIAPDALVAAEAASEEEQAQRRRRFRPAKLAATVVALSLVIFGGGALLTSTNKASALAGHPDKLRNGCTWDNPKNPQAGNYVQNCKVWSKSQNKFVIVQIRASNGSNQGVYLLDGMRASEQRSAWTTDVQAAKVYDSSTDTTLVMPVGGASSFYTDWDGGAGDKNTTIKQETFLTQELPAYLSDNFGVSPNNNAIVGLSMSGGPAVTLAEKHPDQFKVVQAMSGYYQTDNPLGALGVFGTQTMVSNYTNGILNMWGVPGSARWAQNDPSKNVSKLKQNGQTLIISSGNGFLTPTEMAKLKPQDQISAMALEMLSAVSTVIMELQAAQSGANVVVVPNVGGHTWENWGRALQAGRENVLTGLRNTPPVTTKTQLVTANGTPDPDATANVNSAVNLAALEAPAANNRLAQSIATADDSSTSASDSASASDTTSSTESSAASSSASASSESSSAVPTSDPAYSNPRHQNVDAPATIAPTPDDIDMGISTSTPPPPSEDPASTTTTTPAS